MAATARGFSKASSILIFSLLSAVAAKDTQYIFGTSITGVTQQLAVDRTPALYTGDFSDCLGGQSLFNITKFDAAYYTDNSTVLFHLDGQSSIKNESLMVHISMDAYGENRFQMTFDPCFVNIYSLCPLNASVPVTAWAVFAVGPQQVGDIPDLAFAIPDFEGSVRIQLFGNSTQSELACYQASLRNGNTMAYPQAISPVLATFVLVAMLASFATAAYGVSIPSMRTHYAHSLSVMVLFETFQSIFFSGALQLNFPSVLPAWWSNFAWAAGQIYSDSVVRTVDAATGIRGNASQVGDARSSVELVTDLGAGLAQQIYGRSTSASQESAGHLVRRYNASDPFDYTWAGSPISPGVALPGTWTGFPGTLAALNIPAADTFAVGLIWLLVLIGVLVFLLAAFKVSLEALVKVKQIKEDRLTYFRSHWVQYANLTVLRTLFAAFTMITTLAFYQFSSGGSAGGMALAAIFFIMVFLGVGGLAVHACHVRLRNGHYAIDSDRIVFLHGTAWKFAPYVFLSRMSTLQETEQSAPPIASLPFIQIQYHENEPKLITVHQDEPYIKRFGWLCARYRRTRWWFFACYLGYQLFRAAIVGGGSATPMAQVYCLLVYDIVAFFVILHVDPFEGRRNTALAVWMLGISKILTTALSVAFVPTLSVDRIITTAVGFIIIVIQALLTIGVMILVVLSVISSYLSFMRNRDPSHFSPVELNGTRVRYLEHLEKAALDNRVSKAEKERLGRLQKEAEMNVTPPEPSFRVNSVRRVTKIYDEDEDILAALELDRASDAASAATPPQGILSRPWPSRANSTRSTHSLPRGARPYRASWSSQDFAEWDTLSLQRPESGLAKRVSSFSAHGLPFNNTLNSFAEEDDSKNLGLDRRRGSRREETGEMMSGAAAGSVSPEPMRPSTPASSKPASSTTAVQTETPESGRDSARAKKRVSVAESVEEGLPEEEGDGKQLSGSP